MSAVRRERLMNATKGSGCLAVHCAVLVSRPIARVAPDVITLLIVGVPDNRQPDSKHPNLFLPPYLFDVPNRHLEEGLTFHSRGSL